MKIGSRIRNKIIFYSCSIVFFSLLFSGLFFFTTYYHALQSHANESLNASIATIGEQMGDSFEQIENLAFSCLSTRHIRSWTNNNIHFSTEAPNYYRTISEMQEEVRFTLMFNDAWSTKLVNTAYILADGQYIYLASRRSENLDLINSQNKRAFEAADKTKETTVFIPPSADDANAYVVKKIYNINYSKQLILAFTLNPEAFSKNLNSFANGIIACLADQGGHIYFANDDRLNNTDMRRTDGDIRFDNGSARIGDIPATIIRHPLGKSKFSVVVLVPNNLFSDEITREVMHYAFIIGAFILTATLLSLLISSVYTRFIKDLLVSINNFQHKNYDVYMPRYNDTDLNSISEAFNNMAQEIKMLINSVLKYEILLKEADIKLLQSQMNPHFLINTLVTISTAALMNKDKNTYDMVSALTKIMSATLENTRKLDTFIKLSDELHYIKLYLFIQQNRFQNKLRYQIDIEDPALLEYYIPRLSVEPTIENAVVHGIEENLESGEVLIKMYTDGNDLLIGVSDNGKGFDIDEAFKNGDAENNNGHNIGIINTQKRMELLFGKEYGLQYDSQLGKGTKVTIRFPIIKNANGIF